MSMVNFSYTNELEKMYNREMEEIKFKNKINNPEDKIFEGTRSIVLQMGNSINKSRINLVGYDGRFIRSKDISNEDMLSIFREITKNHLTNDEELKTIKSQMNKEFHENKEESRNAGSVSCIS